jgi:transcriptional regulator with XRE-family HTH domain
MPFVYIFLLSYLNVLKNKPFWHTILIYKRCVMESRIKEIRKLRKMTQQELADKVGISQAHIARLEKNERGLDIDVLPLFAKALDVEPWELLPKEMQPDITPEEAEILRAIRKAKSSDSQQNNVSTPRAG